jgi:hypothetical protein
VTTSCGFPVAGNRHIPLQRAVNNREVVDFMGMDFRDVICASKTQWHDAFCEFSTSLPNALSGDLRGFFGNGLHSFGECPELRHAGPNDVNGEAELDRPSRVACSD